MARHSEIFLYGKILNDPIIYYDEEKDLYQRAMFSVVTIQGQRDMDEYIDHLGYETPTIMTRDPGMIRRMLEWKKGNMVEIKGVMTTQEIVKKSRCTHCGEVNVFPQASVTYVTPIYMDLRESPSSEEEVIQLLKRRCEISNHALVVGNLCKNPVFYESRNGKHKETNYQLAINRKYFIKNADPLLRTDYPWVRSYGSIAENDAKALMTGSRILVDGYLKTRTVERTSQCSHCAKDYQWKDTTAMEIVPYSIEYLKDCNDLEKIAKEEDEKLNAMIDDLLA